MCAVTGSGLKDFHISVPTSQKGGSRVSILSIFVFSQKPRFTFDLYLTSIRLVIHYCNVAAFIII